MSFNCENAETVIEVSGLGKSFQMYERPSHRLWQTLIGNRSSLKKDFWALRRVDFSVARGQTVGIVGRNGSGKSTLLQIIAGTLHPSEGNVRVVGRVAALLELGSGFNPEFTGRENVYLNSAILGLTRAQVNARMDRILAFADIGEFIDQPIRSYSSGMAVRLAFAVIAHVDADILIIDEALAVGDAFFSQKCMRFLREFQKTGTLLFVSHDAAAVTNLCEHAIWLENGNVRMSGSSQHVTEAYMAEQHVLDRSDRGERVVLEQRAVGSVDSLEGKDFRAEKMRAAGITNRICLFEFDPNEVGTQFGAQGARIDEVLLLGGSGERLGLVEGGEIVRLQIKVSLLKSLDRLIVGFYVKDRLGQRLFGDNSYLTYHDAPLSGNAGDVLQASFCFRMPVLPSGSYMVDASVATGDQDEHTQQHWIHDALEFRALDETMKHGLIGLPMLEISMGITSA